MAGISSSIVQDHADASYVLQGRMQTIDVLVLDQVRWYRRNMATF